MTPSLISPLVEIRPNMDLAEFIQEVRDLPAWSSHLQEIMAIVNSDELDGRILAQKISHEYVILAKLLRVANSPFYGVSGSIATAVQAINVVGLGNARSIVLAVALMSQTANESLKNFDPYSFWRNAVKVASAAQCLAQKLKLPSCNAFAAAMLHDIGKVVLAYKFPDEYAHINSTPTTCEDEVMDLEHQAFGFDHAELGAALARKWNFPHFFVDGICWHHAPLQSESSYASILWCADQIIRNFDKSFDESKIEAFAKLARPYIELTVDEWRDVMIATNEQINAFEGLF